MLLLLRILAALAPSLLSSPARSERVPVSSFSIDRTEVTVGAFTRYAEAIQLRTAAEAAGGGFEFSIGWVRRPGWTFRAPSGTPAGATEPAVHVSWEEARRYCAAQGGRLPTAAEWRQAAYTEQRASPADDFEPGRTYRYPVGDAPDGMNIAAADPWPRHAPAGATRRGVNGLYEMGANVWEWLADRQGTEVLTAGGSWWYGHEQTRAEAMQWKPAEFYAVYVGFRCAYDS
jgi:formylglycine-generating enzyme required for sulfatase activity